MKVKVLSKSGAAGLVLQGMFADDAAVQTYLMQHIKFAPKFGIAGEFTVGFDGTFTVQEMEVQEALAQQLGVLTVAPVGTMAHEPMMSPTLGAPAVNQTPYQGSHEYPHTVVGVPSETDPDMVYGVAVSGTGEAYACTCKSFEHRPEKACKHMLNAQWTWGTPEPVRLWNAFSVPTLNSYTPVVKRVERELLEMASQPSNRSSYRWR